MTTPATLAPGSYLIPAGFEATLTVTAVPVVVPPIAEGYIWNANAFGPGWQNDDWSSNCTLTHAAAGITMLCTGPWAIWQPYATLLGGTPMNATTDPDSQKGEFNVSPYHSLVLTVQPLQANSDMQVRLVPAGVEDATTPLLLLSKYGTWVANKPTTFTIPLTDLGIGSAAFPGGLVRKVGLQDQSATAANGGASYLIVSAGFI